MKNDENRIIISKISEYRQNGQPFSSSASGLSSVKRWMALLGLIPVLIMVAVLGTFFFAAFLALFVVVASVFGARLWWLRRKLNQSARPEKENREYVDSEIVDIEDAQIIEETKARQKKKQV